MTTHEIIQSKSKLPVYFAVYYGSNQIVPNHWHAHLEIIYIQSGAMHIICRDEKYLLHAGDFFVVNSGDIHYTRTVGGTTVLLLQIPYHFLTQLLPDFDTLRFCELFSGDMQNNDSAFSEMVHHLLSMRSLYEQEKDGYQFLFGSHLQLFLYLLYTHYTKPQQPLLPEKDLKSLARLKEIITYVEAHYMEPLSLSAVSNEFALNTEYFCRYFKKNMGFTFLEYVNMVRLSHIYSDLLQTNETIAVLQERHGFTNYKVFNRMFKEVYGCLPSKIQRS